MQNNDEITPPEGSPDSESNNAAPAAESSQRARGSIFDVRTKRRGGQNKNKLYLGIAAVVIVFLVVVVGGWSLLISKMTESKTTVDESTIKKDSTLDVPKANDDSMKQLQAEQLRRLQEEEAKKALAEAQTQGQQAQNATAGKATAGAAAQTGAQAPINPALTRKMQGTQVVTPAVQDVSSYGAAGAGNASGKPQQAVSLLDPDTGSADAGGLGGGRGSNTRGSLSKLGGTTFTSAKAAFAPSRKYLLTHGTYARCALYTEIVTSQPGLVDCRLTDPMYSADGSTVLAEAGDKLTGEQTVEVGPGQTTVFTAWNELETQSGTRARLDSLGAGPMGASGTEAWIDRHYLQRFGGAVMLSFIQDALQAAANVTQKSGSESGYTVNNSEQNVESMASKALDSTINIPDTGHILPGTVITVIVARDIDFSSVYENR